jgi:hypothetical protein
MLMFTYNIRNFGGSGNDALPTDGQRPGGPRRGSFGPPPGGGM